MKNFISLSFLLLMFVVKNTWGIGSEFKLCTATNPATLNACVQSVRTGIADNIKISGNITCTDVSPCNIDLTFVKGRQISIFGNSSSDSSITRIMSTTSQKPSTINLNFSENITVRDLKLDENYCAGCDSPIAISETKNVVIDRVEIYNSPTIAIAGYNIANGIIRRNTIASNKTIATWIGGDGVRFENNKVLNNASNGILWFANNSHITGNTFSGNHNTAVFNNSGGQVLIEQSNNTYVANNDIGNSSLPGGLQAHGMELGVSESGLKIRGLTVTNNNIYSHDGSGVAFNANGSSYMDAAAPSSFTYNAMSGNNAGNFTMVGGNANNISGVTIANNGRVSLSRPTGYFYNTPTSCKLAPGADYCTVTLCWTTSSVGSARVFVQGDDALFSWNSGRCQSASWISRNGATFQLYTDENKMILLDAIFVYAKD